MGPILFNVVADDLDDGVGYKNLIRFSAEAKLGETDDIAYKESSCAAVVL